MTKNIENHLEKHGDIPNESCRWVYKLRIVQKQTLLSKSLSQPQIKIRNQIISQRFYTKWYKYNI